MVTSTHTRCIPPPVKPNTQTGSPKCLWCVVSSGSFNLPSTSSETAQKSGRDSIRLDVCERQSSRTGHAKKTCPIIPLEFLIARKNSSDIIWHGAVPLYPHAVLAKRRKRCEGGERGGDKGGSKSQILWPNLQHSTTSSDHVASTYQASVSPTSLAKFYH